MTEQELAKQLENAANLLIKHKEEGGCYHCCTKEMEDESINKNLSIVLGWTKDLDGDINDRFFDDGFRLAVKVGYQAVNNIMQTDYDIDFNQVYDKKTGDVCDSEILLYEGTNFQDVAKDIIANYKDVIKHWKEYGHE